MAFEIFLSAALRYLSAWDQWLLFNINLVWTSPAADNLLPRLAQWNQNILIVVCFVGLGFYWSLRDSKNGWKITLLAVLSVLISQITAQQLAKSVVKRSAPQASPTLALQVRVPTTPAYSCPSAPAAAAAALGVIVFATTSGLTAIVALLLSLLVAYSNVYSGTHFPSDGLAGFLLGLLIARLIWNIGGHWAQHIEYQDNATSSRLKKYTRSARNPTGS